MSAQPPLGLIGEPTRTPRAVPRDEQEATLGEIHSAESAGSDANFAVDPGNDSMWGDQWLADSELTISVGNPATPEFQDTVMTDASGWFDLPELGHDAQVGDLITVTDGATTKDHTILSVQVTSVEPTVDVVSGTAPGGANVWVAVWHDEDWNGLDVVANSSGSWTANFSGVFDIRPGSGAGAQVSDGDGDSTAASLQVPNPTFVVSPRESWIDGWEWTPADSVRVAIDDLDVDSLPDFELDTPTDEWGHFETGGLDYGIEPGYTITVSQGTTTKTHIVRNLAVTDIDPDNDTVAGTATTGDQVMVEVYDTPEWVVRWVNVSAGTWSADFSVPGTGDEEQQTWNFEPGTRGAARIHDDDGDYTQDDWGIGTGGSIKGTVTNSLDQPIADCSVYAWRYEGTYDERVGFYAVATDENGDYTIEGLEPGTYRLGFGPSPDFVYALQYYGGSNTLASSDDVVVIGGSDTTGIDARLNPAALVRGTVRDEDGVPIDLTKTSINVQPYYMGNSGWEPVNWIADQGGAGTGSYVLEGMPAGIMRVEFSSPGGVFATEYYNNASTVEIGNNIVLTGGSEVESIDAMLAYAGEMATVQHDAAGVVFNRWVTGYSTAYSGGGYVYGRWTGTELQADFAGSKITWIGPKQPFYGKADVYIDDEFIETVDCYASDAEKTLSATIFESPVLTEGSHTLSIRLNGEKNPASSAYVVVLDRFEVKGGWPSGIGLRIDDSLASPGYTGSWLPYANPTYFNKTYAYSRWTNATFAATFEGTKVAWIGPRTPNYGTADVLIDGEKVATVDCYRGNLAAQGWREVIWESEMLPPGVHTIAIEPTGEKHPDATAANVVVDAIDVTRGGVGVVTPVLDAWSAMRMESAVLAAQSDFGVRLDVLEGPSADHYPAMLERLAGGDYPLVIARSFLMDDALSGVALQHPSTLFASVDGNAEGANIARLSFDTYAGSYLAGVLAASATASNFDPRLNPELRVAFLGGVQIDPLVPYSAGFIGGAKSVDAATVVDVRWVDSFTDTVRAYDLASQQIAEGADVIYAAAGSAGRGAARACRDLGALFIGVDGDQYYTWTDCQNVMLSSVIKDCARADYLAVEAFVHATGTLSPGGEPWVVGLAEDAVRLAPYHDFSGVVPASVTDAVEAARTRLITGE